MNEQSKKLLKNLLGEEGFEQLNKTMYRRDSKSLLSPIDMYLPILAVPRTILSWLVQNIKPMSINEEKIIKYPGLDNFDIIIRKTGIDSYTAQFIDHGKIVHSFENQTLPSVGGHLMSLTESYDEPKAAYSVPAALMEASKIKMPKIPENNTAISALAEVTKVLGRIIDTIMENKFTSDAVKQSKNEIKKKTKKLKKSIEDTGGPGGHAKPSAQVGPMKPISQSRNPKASEFKQITQQTKGKPESEFKKNPEVIQRKIAQAVSKPVKPSNMKKDAAASYFRNYLNKSIIEKREPEFNISEKALYTPCPHCGTAEFIKTESGPKYSPCACFYITANGSDSNQFVRLSKSENGYNLSFSSKADPEVIEAFIETFKNKIHAKYK